MIFKFCKDTQKRRKQLGAGAHVVVPTAIIGTGARQPAKDVFRTPRSDADPSPTATVMCP